MASNEKTDTPGKSKPQIRLVLMIEDSSVKFRSFVGEQFSTATDRISKSIESLHNNLNSWPTTIAITVITCRLTLFPARLFAARNTMILRQAFTTAANRTMKYADLKTSFQNTELWQSWMRESRELGGHPMLSMLPLATHIPTFVLMSSSIRKLCEGFAMAEWASPSSVMALSCVAMNAFILYVKLSFLILLH
jgi:membrane protein insertase Oxa1/YidC/SpoIIIJ